MMLLFLKNNWKAVLIAIAVFSLVSYIGILRWQKNRAIDALQAFKIQVEVAAKTQEVLNAKKVAEQEKITTKTAIAYSDSIERLRKYYEKDNRRFPAAYANGLRLDQTGSGGMSAIPQASGESDAGAEIPGVSAEGVETVTALDCATDVLTLLSLQKWVREQAEAASSE